VLGSMKKVRNELPLDGFTPRQKLDKALAEYTTKYQESESAFRRNNSTSARAVLALCKVVYDAAEALGGYENYLARFRAANKLENKSTFSQFKTIGAQHDRLIRHVNALPSSWFTLYHIARMTNDDFENGLRTKALHPLVTQQEVIQLQPRATAKTRPPKGFLRVDFPSLTGVTATGVVAFQTAFETFLRSQGEPFKLGRVSWSRTLTDAATGTTPPDTGAEDDPFPDEDMLHCIHAEDLDRRCNKALRQLIAREWKFRIDKARKTVPAHVKGRMKRRDAALQRIGLHEEDVLLGADSTGFEYASKAADLERIAQAGRQENATLYRALNILRIPARDILAVMSKHRQSFDKSERAREKSQTAMTHVLPAVPTNTGSLPF